MATHATVAVSTRGAVLTLFVIFLLAACTQRQQGLVDITWVLQQEHEEDTLIPPEVTLEFRPNGEVRGFYSQLNYAGRYTTDGETLTIDDVCWLSLICQAETNMSGPQDYIETLKNAEAYSIKDDTLSIYTGGDTLTFTTST
ncbi:MAG: META domain-containing protein [Chloroflexota bacterium]